MDRTGTRTGFRGPKGEKIAKNNINKAFNARLEII